MIEIIIIILVFSLIGSLIVTIFGYLWVGLLCTAVILIALITACMIVRAACLTGALIIKEAGGKTSKPRRIEKHRENKPELPAPRNEPQTVIQIAVAPDKTERRNQG